MRAVGVAARQEHAEGVPAEARDRVVRAEDVGDALPDLAQDAVARGVPEALVDDLEPVDVEQHDGHRLGARALCRRCERVDHALDERLAGRQARDRVARRERLLVEAGVLERDRRQLRELLERVDLRLAEHSVTRGRREPEHAHHAAADRERNPDAGADLALELGRGALERVVVVDDERLAGSEDLAADALADRELEAHVVGHLADRGAHRQVRVARLAEVDVAGPHAEQARRARQDRIEQLLRADAVEQAHRRLVEGRHELVAGAAERRALGQEQRLVRGLDEGLLVDRVLRMAGNADADRDVRAAALVGDRLDRCADPAGDLLGRLAPAVGQDDGELVAAVAIRPVALADARSRSPG